MNYATYYHEGNEIMHQKVVTSKSIEIQPIHEAGEVQANLTLEEFSIMTFCGKLYNEKLGPICGRTIKIIKACEDHEEGYFQIVACTRTDEEGKYEVEVCGKDNQFYVIVEGDGFITNL